MKISALGEEGGSAAVPAVRAAWAQLYEAGEYRGGEVTWGKPTDGWRPCGFTLVMSGGICVFPRCNKLPSVPRWCWKLLLWPGASDEAPQDPDDPQPAAELRPLQEDGDLCKWGEMRREMLVQSSALSLMKEKKHLTGCTDDHCISPFFRSHFTDALCIR